MSVCLLINLSIYEQTKVGATASAEDLLVTLKSANPTQSLNTLQNNKTDSRTLLFAAAAVQVLNLPADANASLSIAHTWYYPHYYWYRDSHGGSDNGVRYTNTFPTIQSVAASLNLTTMAENLVEWDQVYSGLPDLVLQDAAFNLFSHLRSSMWHRSGEYRQWESFEFVDWSNPTNGDERHLNYFHVLPEAMRSRLLTIINKAQDSDGMFHCMPGRLFRSHPHRCGCVLCCGMCRRACGVAGRECWRLGGAPGLVAISAITKVAV